MPYPEPPDSAFHDRLREHRLRQGLTAKATAATAHVSETAWWRWESGRSTPKLWRAGTIAKALGIPVAALFTDELVIADVVVSAETVAHIKSEGRQAAREAAERIAAQLEPLLYAAATRPPVDTSPGQRPKRRRTRAEVLAGISEARKQAAAKKRRQAQPPIV